MTSHHSASGLIAILCLVTLCGCDAKARPPTAAEVAGTWTGQIGVMKFRLVLNPDGTLGYTDDGKADLMARQTGMHLIPMIGSWRLTPDGEMVIGAEGGATVTSLDLEYLGRDKLRIRQNEQTAFELTRVAAPAPPPATPSPPAGGN